MFQVNANNVNDALAFGVRLLSEFGEPIAPRGMPTLELPGPCITRYDNPIECVLFDPDRDANPFFHLYEALWILNGNNDVESLCKFNSNMSQYSDDGKTFHGAYGYRLRHHFDHDQIGAAIRTIKEDQDTRRCVLAIYDAETDLDALFRLGGPTKDLPCNTHVYLKARNGRLNMTVCCRSNDIIWGAYGANAVQFSFLLQYIAAACGLKVGVYHQFSDSFHVYTEDRQGPKQKQMWEALQAKYNHDECGISYPACKYHETLFHDQWVFDREVCAIVKQPFGLNTYTIPFLRDVARPMFMLLLYHRQFYLRNRSSSIAAWRNDFKPDESFGWLRAAVEWVDRRESKQQV